MNKQDYQKSHLHFKDLWYKKFKFKIFQWQNFKPAFLENLRHYWRIYARGTYCAERFNADFTRIHQASRDVKKQFFLTFFVFYLYYS